MCGLLPVVSRESRSGACMLWLVFQVGEKASQLSLSVEVRAGDGARARPTCGFELQLGVVEVVDPVDMIVIEEGAAAAGLEGGFRHFLLEKRGKLAKKICRRRRSTDSSVGSFGR